MDELHHDDESFAIGWISVSDLLMLGTLSLFLVSHGLEVKSEQKSASIDVLNSDLRMAKSERDESRTRLVDAQAALGELECINIGLIAQIENALHEIIVATVQVKDLKQELEQSRAATEAIRVDFAKTEERLAEAGIKIHELDGMLETERSKSGTFEKHLTERTNELAKANSDLKVALEKIKVANELNGVLRLDKNVLSEKLSLTEINERGFRQELLGIRARNNHLGRVVFVVDRSRSMGDPNNSGDDSRWGYVKSVIEKWLLLLPCEKALLILFNNSPKMFPVSGEYVTLSGDAINRVESVQSLVDVLRETKPDGGTNTHDALAMAYQCKDVDAIFLFTDGQPMIKPESETTSAEFKQLQDQVLELVRTHSKGERRIPVNVIGLGDYFSAMAKKDPVVHLPFGAFMVQIAKESGGVFLGR